MGVPVMLGRNPKDKREDNESNRPLFFPGQDEETELLAQLHET